MGQLYGISREGIFPSCAQCGAAMRTGNAPASRGLVVHGGDGICTTCVKRVERGTTYDYRLDLNRAIALQPGRTPLEREPDLWEAFAEDRNRRQGRITPRQPCAECGQPMRPCNWVQARMPDTVRHGARGVCNVCIKRSQRREEMAS